MSERFLQLNIENEKDHPGDWLASKYPQAFILLYFIARRARRYNGHPDGLIIGDALVGSTDFKPKMTRQNFRTSIEKLVELGYIKIVANGKTFFEREKSTIKVTIIGMLVNLCDTRIWDINSETSNQHANQRPTNGQPTGNHKQERIRKNKNEKEEQEHIAQTAPRLRQKVDAISFSFENQVFDGMNEKDLLAWKELYPSTNVDLELKRMSQWILANPQKSKSKKLWRKFITNWLQRSHEHETNRQAFKVNSPGTFARDIKDKKGELVKSYAEEKGLF